MSPRDNERVPISYTGKPQNPLGYQWYAGDDEYRRKRTMRLIKKVAVHTSLFQFIQLVQSPAPYRRPQWEDSEQFYAAPRGAIDYRT